LVFLKSWDMSGWSSQLKNNSRLSPRNSSIAGTASW
jgi:hypothetical protein